ncbi:MAG: hypothetical protein JXB15_10120 [Anaerolineales bacterium]|nr:hypothetical protein [Anaerolineales bacterium]
MKVFAMHKRRISTMMLILILMILAAMACDDSTLLGSGQPLRTPLPYNQEGLQAAYAAAQATQAAGQSQLMYLSHQATVVSLNIIQAADAAAQSTREYNQRQLMELSIQANEVSQNIARAAATEQFIREQSQMAWNTTATYSAHILNLTQTVQAQAILDAQANATLTAYPLTATPWAAIQADIIRLRNRAERRAWWSDFVITPLIVILLIGLVLLLIVGGVMAYQRLMPVLELRLRTISPNVSPLLVVDGSIVDPDPPHRQLTQLELYLLNHPQPPSDQAVQVEIIGATEPSIANWIIEAEQELRSAGRTQA